MTCPLWTRTTSNSKDQVLNTRFLRFNSRGQVANTRSKSNCPFRARVINTNPTCRRTQCRVRSGGERCSSIPRSHLKYCNSPLRVCFSSNGQSRVLKFSNRLTKTQDFNLNSLQLLDSNKAWCLCSRTLNRRSRRFRHRRPRSNTKGWVCHLSRPTPPSFNNLGWEDIPCPKCLV